jgi:hypothetical protein
MEQVLTRQRMDGNDQRDSLPSADWQSPKEIAYDQNWSFLPVIVGAAAVCLLLYFFVTPGFNAEEESAAKRAAWRNYSNDANSPRCLSLNRDGPAQLSRLAPSSIETRAPLLPPFERSVASWYAPRRAAELLHLSIANG